MTRRVLVINGPNLNMLGVREPHIYGTTSLKTVEASCREAAPHYGVAVELRQSNDEGEIVGWIQEARETFDALIINPAALSFRSVALIDAVRIFEKPTIELHISNIHARDPAHRHSVISQAAKAVICGLGPYGYIVALQAAAQMLGAIPATLPEPLRHGPV